MESSQPSRQFLRSTTVAASFQLTMALPFVLPVALSLIIFVTIGESWPRNIAPGSGLRLPDLMASVVIATLTWHQMVRILACERLRRFAAIACAATGLMGWPIWTVGVLPSINGAMLDQEQVEPMRLGGLDVTRSAKSSTYYSAWLEPVDPNAPIDGGRYVISEVVYQRLASRKPAGVKVAYAKGLLGAQVIIDYQ